VPDALRTHPRKAKATLDEPRRQSLGAIRRRSDVDADVSSVGGPGLLPAAFGRQQIHHLTTQQAPAVGIEGWRGRRA
jgi:hypothetical protein